jgi:hypothetical protein
MLLTVAEAAKIRGTTRFSIHRWIRSGMHAHVVRCKWMIERADLDRFRPRPAGAPRRKGGRSQKTEDGSRKTE